jgi:hypothetical protein
MPQIFSNYAHTLTVGAIIPSATSVTVSVGDGGLFTLPQVFQYELLLLTNGLDWEVVKVETRVDDVFTIVRGHEGPARDWPDGTVVRSMVSAGTLDNFLQRDGLGATVALFAYQHLR